MTEFHKENTDDWKEKLRSAFISAFSGNPQENIQVYTEVGYYYMCCAPSSLYKYYSDRQEKLETVKHMTINTITRIKTVPPPAVRSGPTKQPSGAWRSI